MKPKETSQAEFTVGTATDGFAANLVGERAIRSKGYNPFDPITARIGQRGKWGIVDGGHRLTAARHVMREFWSNLFAPKVRNLYFPRLKTERSNAKSSDPK